MRVYLSLFLLFICSTMMSQDMVYKPINPAFGGDTFNYQWLLSSAEAQNKLKEKDPNNKSLTELERFKENLNSQILSRISSLALNLQFGNDGLKPGSYVFGNLAVDVTTTLEGLSVKILNTSTGEQTIVLIPKS
jgi:curli production assembly/transport component CsgF|nr:curli assembly protein CsgF [uncultured Flavobacterium sp.]